MGTITVVLALLLLVLLGTYVELGLTPFYLIMQLFSSCLIGLAKTFFEKVSSENLFAEIFMAVVFLAVQLELFAYTLNKLADSCPLFSADEILYRWQTIKVCPSCTPDVTPGSRKSFISQDGLLCAIGDEYEVQTWEIENGATEEVFFDGDIPRCFLHTLFFFNGDTDLLLVYASEANPNFLWGTNTPQLHFRILHRQTGHFFRLNQIVDIIGAEFCRFLFSQKNEFENRL